MIALEGEIQTKHQRTARIHVVHGGQSILLDNGKKFHFGRNYKDVQVLDNLLGELGFCVIITKDLKGVKCVK